MDELHGRFRRLDRVATPNLWNEAVARSAEVAPAPRWALSPSAALIAVALTLAALGGTMAVGGWLDRQSPLDEAVTYDNGMIVSWVDCETLLAIDPVSLEEREIATTQPGCFIDDFLGPAWSQDGSRLAYSLVVENEPPSAWVYEPATGESRQIGECGGCEGLDISPDGSLIAYVDWQDGYEVVVTGVDTNEQYRIPTVGHAGRAVFSPDGSRIAFPMHGGKSGVYVVDISGIADGVVGTPTLVHGIVDAGELAWSPDGRWIAMAQAGGLGRSLSDPDRPPFNQQITLSGWGIVIARSDGTEVRVLAVAPIDAYGGETTWAPDSGSLAYEVMPTDDRGVAQSAQLWRVTIDGDEPTLIYESPCCVEASSAPDWSPDGKWIALGVEVAGRRVLTIEGLAADGRLHPVQQAFVDHGALQCGFCTPGMVLAVTALLAQTPAPDEAEIRHFLRGNLCRCTGYVKILDAVRGVIATAGGQA